MLEFSILLIHSFGIPKLIREMNEYGLKEPELVDMEIALRINLYRTEMDTETSQETNQRDSERKISRNKMIGEIKKNPFITQKKLMENQGFPAVVFGILWDS